MRVIFAALLLAFMGFFLHPSMSSQSNSNQGSFGKFVRARLGLGRHSESSRRPIQRPRLSNHLENRPPRQNLGLANSEPKQELTQLSENSGPPRKVASEPLNYYERSPSPDVSPTASSTGSSSPHYVLNLNHSPAKTE